MPSLVLLEIGLQVASKACKRVSDKRRLEGKFVVTVVWAIFYLSPAISFTISFLNNVK